MIPIILELVLESELLLGAHTELTGRTRNYRFNFIAFEAVWAASRP